MIAGREVAVPLRGLPCGRLRGRPCGGAADPCGGIRLTDGSRREVGPLTAADAQAEQDFVRALSLQSRYRRFHVGLPQLPPALLRRLVDVDQQRHVALAVWQAQPQRRIVADARYVRDADGPGADFALAVADDHQGLGLGRQLLQRLLSHAASQGIEVLHGDVLADNGPMIGLVRALGGTLLAQADVAGVLYARLPAAAGAG